MPTGRVYAILDPALTTFPMWRLATASLSGIEGETVSLFLQDRSPVVSAYQRCFNDCNVRGDGPSATRHHARAVIQ